MGAGLGKEEMDGTTKVPTEAKPKSFLNQLCTLIDLRLKNIVNH